ncbi:MAG: 2Fe-2S iron-sulfur cluster binding domain-containing protein [Actinobacteria bacterium]|nr:2Fe-2S iron-sulfur cluster binding domain-containing protein [Actinomycetota bacterium]
MSFVLNRRPQETEIDDSVLLLDFLRDRGLTGAKPSCEMEVCGSCTILIDGLPFSACTTLAVEVEGRTVETIEGVARNGELHPIQEAFVERFAMQCGFCTPGMVLTAKALLESNPDPSRDDILHWMEGNICRCTGYESIVEAILSAAAKAGTGDG